MVLYFICAIVSNSKTYKKSSVIFEWFVGSVHGGTQQNQLGIVSAHCCMYSLSLIIIPRKTTACTIASVRSVIVESTSDVTHEFSNRDLHIPWRWRGFGLTVCSSIFDSVNIFGTTYHSLFAPWRQSRCQYRYTNYRLPMYSKMAISYPWPYSILIDSSLHHDKGLTSAERKRTSTGNVKD